MLTKLLVVFLVVPLAEVVIFLEVGTRIGIWTTLLIIVLTAILGASLAHQEGLKVWWRIQEKLYNGQMPDEELLDGLLILLAGVLLLTPGFLTDAVGFLLLSPKTRHRVRHWLRSKLTQRFQLHSREW